MIMLVIEQQLGEQNVLKSLILLGRVSPVKIFKHYAICYEAQSPLSKEKREELKKLGWSCERHSRTRREMWVYNYPEGMTEVEDVLKGIGTEIH
jgi:hypothetical protein